MDIGIVRTDCIRIGNKTTVCLLTLENGFEIVGTSACVDLSMFCEETGKKLAYENALEKWHQYKAIKLQQDWYEDKECMRGIDPVR